MAALIEVAESFLKILEEGGAKQFPQIDIVVEGFRQRLRNDYGAFEDLIVTELLFWLEDPTLCKKLSKKFYKVNRLRLAELVLSEREIG